MAAQKLQRILNKLYEIRTIGDNVIKKFLWENAVICSLETWNCSTVFNLLENKLYPVQIVTWRWPKLKADYSY